MADADNRPAIIRVCTRCGSIVPRYEVPIPSAQLLARQVQHHAELYGDFKPEEGGRLSEDAGGILSSNAELLGPPQPNRVVVEIGAGRGALLAALRERGYGIRGCEPSRELCELALKAYRFSPDELQPITGEELFAQLHAQKREVSAVFLWHVLEHVANPLGLLREMARVLPPGAPAFFQVPGMRSDHLYPEHLTLFTEPAIHALAWNSGFDVVSVDYDTANFFISFVYRRNQLPIESGWRELPEAPLGAWQSPWQVDLFRARKALAAAERDLANTRGQSQDRSAEVAQLTQLSLELSAQLQQQTREAQSRIEELARMRDQYNSLMTEYQTTATALRKYETARYVARQLVERVWSGVSDKVGLRRDKSPAAIAETAPETLPANTLAADVLFFNGCTSGESTRYRVTNVMAALERVQVSSKVIDHGDLGRVLDGGLDIRALVLFRAAMDDGLRKLIDKARESGAHVFFDVDDLVFEPESIDLVRVVKDTFTPAQRAEYLDGVERFRKTLLASDFVICPTAYLCKRAAPLGKPTFVIPNTLNADQLHAGETLKVARDPKTVRIAYFSGSNTHQVDFRACEAALLRIMQERPEVRFVLVGILDLGPAWDRFRDRIERVPFQPYLQMLETLAGIDINLAPLELGNPYVEGKSQLKIFEAGLVRVPTIASATASYSEAIKQGESGFLARGQGDWLDALEKLVGDAELRRRMGERARESSLRSYSFEGIAGRAKETLFFPRRGRGAEKQTQALKVSWIIPDLPLGSGGHRNILRVAYFLEQFGHDVSLYFSHTESGAGELTRRMRKHFYPSRAKVQRYEGEVEPTDVLFATAWHTAEMAVKHKDRAKMLAYFVQDFEPMFMPMGTGYVLAENTYRMGLYHITSGPWCAHLLRQQFGVEADSFVFPIDRTVYYPRQRQDTSGELVFFGRPEMPRRCFELGVMMLEELKKLHPDVRITIYGSQSLSQHTYPFRANLMGLAPSIEDLAQLYTRADVGVVFSTTNPSLVPYEMMACGLPVVDLGRPDSEINYGGKKDIALLADPQPHAMALQIAALLKDPVERKRRSNAGIEFVRSFPDEEQMARRVEELMLKKFRSLT